MIARILLPLDGSKAAEIAIPYGEELSRRLGAEVVLLHVLRPDHRQHEDEQRLYMDNIAEGLAQNLSKGQPEGTSVKVQVRIEQGGPSDGICRLVDDGGVDLIVMTSTGASGPKVARLGNVADHICHTVPVPVMLIKPHADRVRNAGKMINRVLVPLDGSDLSKLALPVAEELASRLKVPIDLFQMARIIRSFGDEPAPFVDYVKMTEDEERRVRGEMAALAGELTGKGLTAAWSVNSGADAATEIIRAAEKVRADLVILSTHGRSGLGHLLLGSVAEKVLRHGEMPLLLVHARAGRLY
jgi:nucleotide-binding universal stress UspA family protein